MKLDELLELVLQQDFHISRENKPGKEKISLYISNWNCQLSLTSTNSNQLLLTISSGSQSGKIKNTAYEKPLERYLVEDVDSIKKFLDVLFTLEQIDYLAEYHPKDECKDYTNLIIGLFKKILACEPIPKGYSTNLDSNNKPPKGIIKLYANNSEIVHQLNLSQLNRRLEESIVSSLLSTLEVETRIHTQKDTFNGKYFDISFEIPGYELEKYPMLQHFNNVPKVSNNFDKWLKQAVMNTDSKREKWQMSLHQVLLEQELENNGSVKRAKKKI